MAASTRRSSGLVHRSLSPSGRFCSSSHTSTFSRSSAFASSSSAFSSPSTKFFHRSASPTRVNLYSSTPSVRFSSPNRSISVSNPNQVVKKSKNNLFESVRFSSPNRSISVSNPNQVVKKPNNNQTKRTCMCSPTTHPGSFRCSMHKNLTTHPGSFRCSMHKNLNSSNNQQTASYNSNRLNARRSAMTNSLVRIGTVEGDLMKRTLASLIRPSSHQQRRRTAFQARPSRLSIMSKSEDL